MFWVRHSIIDTFVVCPWSCMVRTKKQKPTQTSLFCHLSNVPRTRMNSHTAGLMEAITFECQKKNLQSYFLILVAQQRPWMAMGGKGNDLVLFPVTVHNSISNIFPCKSLRLALMYLAYLVYVFSLTLPPLFMLSFTIQQDDMWQIKLTAKAKSPLLFVCHFCA